ncbi:dihydroxyacetone kinase subunit DhaL [Actinomyces ruminis]
MTTSTAQTPSAPLTALAAADAAAWIRRADQLISAHADELTALDAAIGDADHGANMKRGLNAAVEALPEQPDAPASVLKQTAMALISKVGGAAGPLYGTFFLRMSTACAKHETIDAAILVDAVEAGIGGIVQRGNAEAGDKTMLDAWYPALEALRAGTDGATFADAVSSAADAAAAGRDATEPMLAKKGRASYLGERSIGISTGCRLHRSDCAGARRRRLRPDGGRRMTGIVIVSHSRPLADAALALAKGLIPGLDAPVEVAAGLPDGTLGTDATEIMAAIERADDGVGVLVLADLGSGVLSAQMALELLDPDLAERVRLSGGALVEGLVAAYAAAGTGKDLDAVQADADAAASLKLRQVAGPPPP